jgi:hypothetical protein
MSADLRYDPGAKARRRDDKRRFQEAALVC